MLAWMLYVMTVTLLLSTGAFIAERALRLNRGGTRWIWLAAIAASLCLPLLADSLHSRRPAVVSLPVAEGNAAPDLPQVQILSPATWIAGAPETPAWWNDLDALLRGMWLGASATLLLVLLAGSVHLALRMRRWQPAVLAGAPVLVSEDAGPAGGVHREVRLEHAAVRAGFHKQQGFAGRFGAGGHHDRQGLGGLRILVEIAVQHAHGQHCIARHAGRAQGHGPARRAHG